MDIAQREKLSPSYVTRLLRLTSLAPDITAAMLQGRQPESLTAYRLLASPLPLSRRAQRHALGFGTGADLRGRTNLY